MTARTQYEKDVFTAILAPFRPKPGISDQDKGSNTRNPLMHTGYSQQVPVYLDDVEIILDVTYSYSPGTPEQGPSYASGGQPAEGPEIEITGMSIVTKEFPGGVQVPNWFFDAVIAGERVMDYLRDNHDGDEDDDSDRADYEYDRDRDERMEREA